MTSPRPPLEEQVRAMLRRRAEDVHPHRRPWDELTSADVTGTVIELHPEEPGGRRRSRGTVPLRPLAAAASVLFIVFVGVMVVDNRRGGDGREAEAPTADGGSPDADPAEARRNAVDGFDLPAAGSNEFNVYTALPVYPVLDELDLNAGLLEELADPTQVALEYLELAGIEAPNLEPAADDSGETDPRVMSTAGVFWSIEGPGGADDRLTSGTVFLRRVDAFSPVERPYPTDDPDPEGWVVVGAMTYGLRVKDVHREPGRLSFSVDRRDDESGVEVAEVEVEAGGETLLLGEVLPGTRRMVDVRVPEGGPAVIRVRHVDSANRSIGETTVPGY